MPKASTPAVGRLHSSFIILPFLKQRQPQGGGQHRRTAQAEQRRVTRRQVRRSDRGHREAQGTRQVVRQPGNRGPAAYQQEASDGRIRVLVGGVGKRHLQFVGRRVRVGRQESAGVVRQLV